MKHRLFVAGVHLGASVVAAAAVSVLVFTLWYPSAYAAISGGLTLFMLLVGVDVVLGPALTAIAASPGKPWKELARDLAIIILVQVAALAYGVHSLAMARPVALVFEVDRLRVVSAADIEPTLLQSARVEYRDLSWTGPRLVAAPKPTDPIKQLQSIELGLAGIDLGMNPQNWVEYDATQRSNAVKVARPVSQLLARYPQATDEVGRIAAAAGQAPARLSFLPLQARHAAWTSLIGPDGQVLGHIPVDGFL